MGMTSIWHLIALPLVLVIPIPAMSLTVRRLHDLNFSGWWIIPLYILNIFYIGLVISLLLFFIPGKDEDNKFGKSPYSE